VASPSRSALFLPKGASPAIVTKLNAAARKAMDEVHDRLAALGATVVAPDRQTPEYLGMFVRAEIAKWSTPIRESGVVIE
jgi:tripartite-type tricarboxylate transporter receptor subunit TctC